MVARAVPWRRRPELPPRVRPVRRPPRRPRPRRARRAPATPPAAPAAATPPVPPPAARPSLPAEVALTKEPLYEGEPILAVAADSEEIAAAAIERIIVEYEPLPFVIDPLDSLRPGGPDGRTQGNVFVGANVETLKWTADDIAQVAGGQVPDRRRGLRDADLR